jgi:hypothetical protein
MSNAPRIRCESGIVRYSLFSTNNLISNKKFLSDFFNYYYYYNTPEILRVCGGIYLNFNTQKDIIIDHYEKKASFKGFNFSKKNLYDSLIESKNLTPFYAYVNRTKGVYRICGGRHRM